MSSSVASPAIVLVRPQLAENIGAAARAMSNFGLSDLRLVSPRQGWPHGKARDMASGAEHIIKAARVFGSIPEALEGIHIVYAATARSRDMTKPVALPEEAAAGLHTAIVQGRTCALLFGPERTGLENDDLVLADTLVTIPTDAVNASLNLAQSVVVLAYVWWRAAGTLPALPETPPLATKDELQGFFDQLEGYLDDVDHFRAAHKKPVMWRNVQTIFVRAGMNPQEVQSLRGVIRALYARRREGD